MKGCACSQFQKPRFPIYLPQEELDALAETANALVICGKGILAADENPSTLGIRFQTVDLENTKINRRRYREILFSTDCSIKKYISGIVVHPDTLEECDADGKPLIDLIKNRQIIPGVKVNLGFVELPGTFDDCTTEGLDDLARRCADYREWGCRFAKWRCVFKISSPTPSFLALKEAANTLARYAAISQIAGLVPLIEPEVIVEGNHNLEMSKRVNQEVLAYVFKALQGSHIFLEGLLLEMNFVRAGHTNCSQSNFHENATATLEVIQRTVPPAVPGILFLSGGLSEDDATLNLNTINKMLGRKLWTLTFSYGRAMHNPVLAAWKGIDEHIPTAQCVLMRLARHNSEASMGRYEGVKKGPVGNRSMFVANYAY